MPISPSHGRIRQARRLPDARDELIIHLFGVVHGVVAGVRALIAFLLVAVVVLRILQRTVAGGMDGARR